MTPELTYLAWTALLTGSLWVVYVACQVMTNGFLSTTDYIDPTPRPLPLWGKRADRALMNGVETFAPFAALVLIIQASGQNNGTTAFLCMAFFWLRLAHAVVYWAGVPYIRTVLFTLGWITELGLFWQIVT